MALVTCTTAALMFTQSVFWSLPTAVLAGTAAAAGIAWINSVGNLAGYLSPFLVGRVRDVSGTMPGLLRLGRLLPGGLGDFAGGRAIPDWWDSSGDGTRRIPT